MEKTIFNLEKIKEITNPIEELQGKASFLEKIYEDFMENKKSNNILSNKEENQNQIQELTEILSQIKDDLLEISKTNITKFLFFQDNLIQKYKESFKDSLKHLDLTENSTRQIGLFLIDKKKISKIIDKSSFISSLSLNQWISLLNSLKKNSLFLSSINNIKEFYDTIMKKRLTLELNDIPEHVDPSLIDEYKKSFFIEEKSFEQYLEEIESHLSKEE
ncbi:MAG: hypothetical protein GY870_11350, partial [archaeon]|nr:hypothetical protein [archaeon]